METFFFFFTVVGGYSVDKGIRQKSYLKPFVARSHCNAYSFFLGEGRGGTQGTCSHTHLIQRTLSKQSVRQYGIF